MLRGVIYFNVFLLFIMAIYFIIVSNKNNSRLRSLKKLIIIYIIYDIISIYICYSNKIVEIDWDVFYLIPISIVSLVLYIISIYCINKLLKEQREDNNKSIKYIVIMILPALLFVFAYMFELYIINKCEYLLKYNYQDGVVVSKDTQIAIINNKPLSVTLQNNIFDRNGKLSEVKEYKIVYDDEIVTINPNYEKEKIRKIALNAKEKNKNAKSASIYYLSEGEYAIIILLSEKDSGTVLDEYFYYNGKYVKSIKTNGTIDSVIYYNS